MAITSSDEKTTTTTVTTASPDMTTTSVTTATTTVSADMKVTPTTTTDVSAEEVKNPPATTASSETTPIPTSTPKSRLLSLPTELRLKIYTFLFTLVNTDRLTRIKLTHRPNKWANYSSPPSVLSILATNQQINAEATPFFYSLNTLIFPIQHLPRSLPRNLGPRPPSFLSSLSPPRKAAIRFLVLRVLDVKALLRVLDEISSLSNLRHLRVERTLSARYHSVEDIALWQEATVEIKNALGIFSSLRKIELRTTAIPKEKEDEDSPMMVSSDQDEQRGRILEKVDQGLLASLGERGVETVVVVRDLETWACHSSASGMRRPIRLRGCAHCALTEEGGKVCVDYSFRW